LTSIYNDVERGKATYNAILDLNASNLSDTRSGTKENIKSTTKHDDAKAEDSIDDLEEDLEFLLSLKEPIQSTVIGIVQPMSLPTSHNSGKILD